GGVGHDVPLRPAAVLGGGPAGPRPGGVGPARRDPTPLRLRVRLSDGAERVAPGRRIAPVRAGRAVKRPVRPAAGRRAGRLQGRAPGAGLRPADRDRARRAAVAAAVVPEAPVLVLPLRHAPSPSVPRAGGLLPI